MDVCTREYLQNLPIQRRKEHVAQFCQQYRQAILNHAANGHTNYIITSDTNHKKGLISNAQWMNTPPSTEEIIEFLKEKFPDSKISYEEQWQDVAPGRRELKKGILVDWS
jgi:hypothetical protein